ncbi:L-serine ammonia-lyase, iron-sulfur-dependent subunit beta [Bacillus sp. JJ664]
MKYKSVFDIIGPIMIGPSSSHTAGAAKIGRVARNLYGKEPKNIVISLYGSFAKTYRGHGTDVALIGGLLDFDTFDERIPESLNISKDKGMTVEFIEEDAITEHPNTVKISIQDDVNQPFELVGVSIGGGKIEIVELNGFELKLSGNYPAILVVHNDRYGSIAGVTNVLMKYAVNIGHMEVSRKEVGQIALMAIEVDQDLDEKILKEIESLPHIIRVTKMVD